jgi:hypothetical protein
MNRTLTLLSLTYCGITAAGAHSLLEIIIFQQSELKELDLQGNMLENGGVTEVLHACKIN